MKMPSPIDSLLTKPVKKVDRVKSSFVLDRKLFDGFRALCEERQITQSEMLDAMMEEVLKRYEALGKVAKTGS